MAKWQYLLFDADNTLYDFNSTEKTALAKLFEHYKLSETLLPVYHSGNKDCWAMYEKGELTLEKLESERFRLFFQRASIDEDPEEAGALYSVYLGEAGIMMDGAISFLEKLEGWDISLITNGIARVQKERIRRTGTAHFYSHVFISQEIGYAKPDSRFFEYVLSVLNATKDECLVIGDSLTSDIQGAKLSGIDSIFFSTEGRTTEDATFNASSYDEIFRIIKSE
ncbi:MAG: noncanonical pyrimidine nucleotidase, YjjG family [Spirochaetes bacterium]|uniref:Noncanonical pyrimidine nucleotidase, YjjG family n=1 Tax=Candidatus Ornithospirochaeta stercoripullorum TaxID=2840899 RepID=A0A9D9E0J8_9SPIO|nr:noncanonical pyrimidine nucleotidase, YjjG family [Candidatus Ornithospirochaeta stercoripullorum]